MRTINNIFLVDDDEIFSFLTTQTIFDTNMVEEVTTFKNGMEILEYLQNNGHQPSALPEIILLDLNMPIMDGWQFLEHYATLPLSIQNEIKIYVLSSSNFSEDIARAKNTSQVEDYIIKPISKEKLQGIIMSFA
jgi:CheY-like chemotaxis protein